LDLYLAKFLDSFRTFSLMYGIILQLRYVRYVLYY